MTTLFAPSLKVGSLLQDRKQTDLLTRHFHRMFTAAGVPEKHIRVDVPGRDMSRGANVRGQMNLSSFGEDPFEAFEDMRPEELTMELFGQEELRNPVEMFSDPEYIAAMSAQQAALKEKLGGNGQSLTGVEETMLVIALATLAVTALGTAYTIYDGERAEARRKKKEAKEKAKREAEARGSEGVVAMEPDDNNNGVPDYLEEGFGNLSLVLQSITASNGPMPSVIEAAHVSLSEAKDGLMVSVRLAANGRDVRGAMLIRD